MTYAQHGRSMPELLGGLVSDLSGLFRKELQLAKTEASEKVDQVVSASLSLLFGGILALGALGVLLSAIVTGIGAFFVSTGMEQTAANSLAAGIVTVVVGIVAWMLIGRGLSALKARNLMLQRTTHSLAQDADVVKEKF
jgi:succinate dehydrogenase/fumarate reductase cytochrome b subunit